MTRDQAERLADEHLAVRATYMLGLAKGWSVGVRDATDAVARVVEAA